MDLDGIPSAIGAAGTWEKRADGWRLDVPGADPAVMARAMLDAGARLVTMTAISVPEGEFRVIYHWDVEGRLLNTAVMTKEETLPSISAITPAADWIEREIHDYFAVKFTGRDLPPIFLAPEDPAGALRWNLRWEGPGKEGKGKG